MTVPSNAIVSFEGKTGVFVAGPSTSQPQPASNPPDSLTARFQQVQTGIRDGEQVEITSGLNEAARVITTGATALRDGDRIVAANTSNRTGAAGAGQEKTK